MNKQTLYQISTSTGKTKVWSIEVINKDNNSEVIIQSGQLGGKQITNKEIVSEGKNLGKTNETNHYTQAVSQAQSKIENKLKKGYVEDLNMVKSSDTLGSGIPAPMLAQRYSPNGEQKNSKTLKQIGILGKQILISPKVDGNRALIKVENGHAEMYSRSGKLMPVQLNHILEEILVNYKRNQYSKTFWADGELFSDEMTFNELNGLLKKEKASPEQIEKQKKIKFYLFDTISEDGYEKRYEVIKKFVSPHVVLVPSYPLIATDSSIAHELGNFINQGYEGLIIRIPGKPYENRRSWSLVKVKSFEDSEMKLVGFEEDSRSGFVGSFIMQLPKPTKDRDGKPITTFNAGASGQTEDERRYMWKHQEEFIGKMATIEYFGLSEYGVPRFPKMKGIRDEKI